MTMKFTFAFFPKMFRPKMEVIRDDSESNSE